MVNTACVDGINDIFANMHLNDTKSSDIVQHENSDDDYYSSNTNNTDDTTVQSDTKPSNTIQR